MVACIRRLIYCLITVVVDQIEAVMHEAGEIIDAIKQNVLKQSEIIELGNLIQRDINALVNHLSVFKSVGLAIQDISCAELVYQQVTQKNIGIDCTL